MKIPSCIAAMVGLSAFLPIAQAANPPWVCETVDTGTLARPEVQIAPDGLPAVAYFQNDSTLVYATIDDGSWSKEVIDATLSAPAGLSLAFTPEGRPAIAYYDGGREELRYASRDASTWSFATVPVEVSELGSLAFTPSGEPAIAHLDDNSGLRYLVKKNGAWTETGAVASALPGSIPGSTARLAFAPDGQPAMAFIDRNTSEAKYAKFDGTAWIIETVAPKIFVLDFEFSPSGEPAFALVEFPTLKYATRSGGTWTTTVVGASAGDISLAFAGGHPAIAYHDFSSNLRYAGFDGAAWSHFEVDHFGDFGGYVSLATADSGQPAVAYRSGGDENGVGASIKLASPPAIVPVEVTSFSKSGNIVTTSFKGEAGITDWRFRSSQDLRVFAKDETPNTVFNETSPGEYSAQTTLTSVPLQFFLTIGREAAP